MPAHSRVDERVQQACEQRPGGANGAVVLHDGVDSSDHNTTKADCGVDKDVEKWVAVNRWESRGVDVRETWIDKKCVYIRWRQGSFMESELLILRVEEVGYARNDGIICLVVA